MKKSTLTRKYFGDFTDLLKKCTSASSACIIRMDLSIACIMSSFWVTDFYCLKKVVRTTCLLKTSFALPPFLTKLLYKLYKTLSFSYLFFEIFLTIFLLSVSPFAKSTLFSSTLNFVSKFVILFLGLTCFFYFSSPLLVSSFFILSLNVLFVLLCSSLHNSWKVWSLLCVIVV